MPPSQTHFTRRLFQFLEELEQNNDREWFNANKPRYLSEARDPLLTFIADLSVPFRTLSPQFNVSSKPVGGSMFRIYRDLRFSKDKRPYKTYLAARFAHRGSKGKSAPGFYLSLSAKGAYGGAGIWRPGSAELGAIRKSIVEQPAAWQEVSESLSLEGERLKRPPRGFDPDHSLIEDIKKKDYVCSRHFEQQQVCSQDFLPQFVETCKSFAPLVRFLCRALELPW